RLHKSVARRDRFNPLCWNKYSNKLDCMDVDQRLAERVRNLRKAQGLTLERLAELSGVSRSMISLIEREETSPTAAVLDKLAGAFRISLPALFSYEAEDAFALPLARADTQPLWKDPESGYVRRHVSPPG